MESHDPKNRAIETLFGPIDCFEHHYRSLTQRDFVQVRSSDAPAYTPTKFKIKVYRYF